MKKRLVITIDDDEDSYELDTPDGPINHDLLGRSIADMLVRLFDPDNPIEVNEDGVMDINKHIQESKLPSMMKLPKGNKPPN